MAHRRRCAKLPVPEPSKVASILETTRASNRPETSSRSGSFFNRFANALCSVCRLVRTEVLGLLTLYPSLPLQQGEEDRAQHSARGRMSR